MVTHTVQYNSLSRWMSIYPQGLTPKVDSMALEDTRRLQEQNSILWAMVTQMRRHMEAFQPHLRAQPQASFPQPVHLSQMASRPLPQSTDISRSISPAGVDNSLVHKHGWCLSSSPDKCTFITLCAVASNNTTKMDFYYCLDQGFWTICNLKLAYVTNA